LKKIVIVGVGLIGGSFALALRADTSQQFHIVGIDRDRDALDAAEQRRVIDARGDFASALPGADLVLIAVPVRQLPTTFAAIAPHLALHDSATTLVMDVGSTKCDVLAAATTHLGEHASRFVAAHPIAGRETSGVAAAEAGLFAGKNVILAPSDANTPACVTEAASWWKACGANPIVMSAAAHDAVFAAVSHLPHLLAFALVDELAARDNARQLFSFAASGFRDFTRIAGSSPEMWRDIALNNRDALLAELDAYAAKVAALRQQVASADAEGLEALMRRARTARAKWLAGDLDSFNSNGNTEAL
jgi:prephenate dehydrogenase